VITRHRPELPNDLPPARLYLDDVEQIGKIFEDATQGPVRYRVGSAHCDTVEDLREFGNRITTLEIAAASPRGLPITRCILSITRASVTFYGYGAKEAFEQEIKAKLWGIFEARKSRWKSLLRLIPYPVYLCLGVALPVIVMHYVPDSSVLRPRGLGAGIITWAIFSIVAAMSVFLPCVVELRREHEASITWQTLKPYVIGAFLGAFFGVLGSTVAQHLLKLIWP